MPQPEGHKTSQQHWNDAWKTSIRMTLPNRLFVDILNFTRLMAKYVKPGDKYIEIGCAPGKLLSWVAAKLHAEVSGLDYSEEGIKSCQQLFKALDLPVKLYQEDLFDNSLPKQSFDIVTSFGVIEHFEDPREAIEKHLELLKPGGVAIISIPNYSGIICSLQRWVDAKSLELHNLEIMNPVNLANLVPYNEKYEVQAYRFGSLSPWLISWEKKLPRLLSKSLCCLLNFLGLLQPITIPTLCPIIVLEIKKAK